MVAATNAVKRGVSAVAVAAMLTAAPMPEAFACGYDDPQLVSLGALNWAYPDSLYVIGAISREVAARRLPLAKFNQGGPDLFGRNYRATTLALQKFGGMLGAAAAELRTPIALVLVEPMLWTRFESVPGGIRTRVHASSAEPGDLVLVSGEAVIAEIAGRRLTLVDAVERGVLRLYGTEPQVGEFLGLFGRVGAAAGAAATSRLVDRRLAASVSPLSGNRSGSTGATHARPAMSFKEGQRPGACGRDAAL